MKVSLPGLREPSDPIPELCPAGGHGGTLRPEQDRIKELRGRRPACVPRAAPGARRLAMWGSHP